MEDDFEISVTQNGKELTFKAQLMATGYIHKVVVAINDIEVWYEPDEERNYRAIINGETIDKIKESDIEIIKAIGEQLQVITKK